MAEYESLQNESRGLSQRKITEAVGIPRSTLQYWLAHKQGIDTEPELVDFFESDGGIVFLHRLVVAAHLSITLLVPSGMRVVYHFLELSCLD